LALTSPTSGGRSAGLGRLWTKATEFICLSVAGNMYVVLNDGVIGEKLIGNYVKGIGRCLV
jgi:hypothetical protein